MEHQHVTNVIAKEVHPARVSSRCTRRVVAPPGSTRSSYPAPTTRPIPLSRLGLALPAGSARAKLRIDFSPALTPLSLGGLGCGLGCGQGCGQGSFPEGVVAHAGQPTMALTSISSWSGNPGGGGHVTTHLVLYDGDPDLATLVGTTSNTIHTAVLHAVALDVRLASARREHGVLRRALGLVQRIQSDQHGQAWAAGVRPHGRAERPVPSALDHLLQTGGTR